MNIKTLEALVLGMSLTFHDQYKPSVGQKWENKALLPNVLFTLGATTIIG